MKMTMMMIMMMMMMMMMTGLLAGTIDLKNKNK